MWSLRDYILVYGQVCMANPNLTPLLAQVSDQIVGEWDLHT